MNQSAGSLPRLDPHLLHQLGGGEHVFAEILAELVDAHRHRLGADLGEPLLHDGNLQRLAALVVELADHVARRLGRHEDAGPEQVGRILQSKLRGGRHIGQRQRARIGTHRQREQLAFLHQRERWGERQEVEIDPPGHQFGESLVRSPEGHVLRVDAGAQPEAFGREMRHRADAGGGEVHRSGLGLGGGDQVGGGLEAFRRRHHEHGRRLAERDDGREVVERVVGQVLVERISGTERGGMHQDGVTVRLCLGDRADAERAAGARPVLDHDRLVDLLRHLFEHDAADDVVGGTGGERHDRLHGALGPALRQHHALSAEHQRESRERACAQARADGRDLQHWRFL